MMTDPLVTFLMIIAGIVTAGFIAGIIFMAYLIKTKQMCRIPDTPKVPPPPNVGRAEMKEQNANA